MMVVIVLSLIDGEVDHFPATFIIIRATASCDVEILEFGRDLICNDSSI